VRERDSTKVRHEERECESVSERESSSGTGPLVVILHHRAPCFIGIRICARSTVEGGSSGPDTAQLSRVVCRSQLKTHRYQPPPSHQCIATRARNTQWRASARSAVSQSAAWQPPVVFRGRGVRSVCWKGVGGVVREAEATPPQLRCNSAFIPRRLLSHAASRTLSLLSLSWIDRTISRAGLERRLSLAASRVPLVVPLVSDSSWSLPVLHRRQY